MGDMNRFLHLLDSRPFLLADGATGTNLFAAGLESGAAPELWNRNHPERIAALHRSMIEAGADIVLTNSFGGTRNRLKLHTTEDDVPVLNRLAAEIARAEADRSGRTVIVAGSIGPTGELFQPLGPLTHDMAVESFAQQAKALAHGGADVIWVETISARDELQAALEGAQESGLPVVCTLSFDTNGRTMMGVTPQQLAQFCDHTSCRPVAYGANCGAGAPDMIAAIVAMAGAAQAQDILIAKGNCGVPYYQDGAVRYDGTPELMGHYARLARDAGARIIGGCCGTTPEHLAAMRKALDGYEPQARPDPAEIENMLGPLSAGARQVLTGETAIPAESRRRGSRRLRTGETMPE